MGAVTVHVYKVSYYLLGALQHWFQLCTYISLFPLHTLHAFFCVDSHEIAMNLMQEQVLEAEEDEPVQSSDRAPPQPKPSSQNPVQRETLLGPPPTSRDEYEQAAQAYENQRRQNRSQVCL